MPIVTSTNQAKIGEEDIRFGLYQKWKGKQKPDTETYTSWQLRCKIETSRESIATTQLANKDQRSPSSRMLSARARFGQRRTAIHSL